MILQAVAHDIKNKLAELAMRLMDRDIEAAALALDAADQLSHALLLDNPDQIETQIDSTSPGDLAEELGAVYGQLFPDKKVAVDLSRAPTLWCYDVALMRLALSNVVHNAFKHADSTVTLSVYELDGDLVFEVHNDGAEYPSALLNKNWNEAGDSNVDAQASKASLGYGTGLGLLLAHKISHAHKLERNNAQHTGWLALTNDNGAVTRIAVP